MARLVFFLSIVVFNFGSFCSSNAIAFGDDLPVDALTERLTWYSKLIPNTDDKARSRLVQGLASKAYHSLATQILATVPSKNLVMDVAVYFSPTSEMADINALIPEGMGLRAVDQRHDNREIVGMIVRAPVADLLQLAGSSEILHLELASSYHSGKYWRKLIEALSQYNYPFKNKSRKNQSCEGPLLNRHRLR